MSCKSYREEGNYLCIKHDSTEDPCVPHGLPQGIQGLLCDRQTGLLTRPFSA